EVGLPDAAVAGDRHEVAVIIQIVHTRLVGRCDARAAGSGSVTVAILGLPAIVAIGRIVVVILGDHEGVLVRLGGIVLCSFSASSFSARRISREFDGCAVLLSYFELSGGAGGAQFAPENGHGGVARAVEFDAKMRGVRDADGFVGK